MGGNEFAITSNSEFDYRLALYVFIERVIRIAPYSVNVFSYGATILRCLIKTAIVQFGTYEVVGTDVLSACLNIANGSASHIQYRANQ